MTREDIISAIDEEIARLEKVRALLRDNTGAKFLSSGAVVNTRKKRNLSPDARKRIADAQKRRWAKQKKQSGSGSK